jgi:hypothetical protein
MIESLLNTNAKGFVPNAIVIEDHHCQLGKWLYAEESKKYSSNKIFNELQNAHKSFHLLAGEILQLYESDKAGDISEKIDSFNQLSEEVISCLAQMKALT